MTAAGGSYTITQPGSYKLSGDLQAKDLNTDVIVIASDHVTIDLNGFAILGTNDCSTPACKSAGTGHGIVTSSTARNPGDFYNITIRNGVIQGMGDAGIHLNGDSVLIEYITSRNKGGSGIDVFKFAKVGPQFSVIVQHNNVALNGWNGITVLGGGSITDNICTGNQLSGVIFPFVNPTTYGTVARNVLTNNGQYGVAAIGGFVSLIGNVMVGNAVGPYAGGINQGQNLCGSAACPGAVF